ncbi:MAG: shikimate dehydrogenase [Proteobacteria bacterium]|nr:shikimate dehydrogenase [Pseudomonadota bacterium]
MTENERFIQAGVIGWPVSHSLSPRLHGYWLKEHGINGVYEPLPVPPETLRLFLLKLASQEFAGVNITVPHKEAAVAHMDTVDDNVRRIGAVNTVVVQEGKLYGGNTDGFGFMENLKGGAPDWAADQGPVTVLGAGGAARAVVVALLDAGVSELRLVNRTKERAERLAKEIGGAITVVEWDKRASALEEIGLLVNTTTLGMTGKDPLDLDLVALPESAVVTDIVYTPLTTPLLAAAGGRGNPTVDGLGMLLHQARPGFFFWFGVKPEVTDALRTFILEGLEPC